MLLKWSMTLALACVLALSSLAQNAPAKSAKTKAGKAKATQPKAAKANPDQASVAQDLMDKAQRSLDKADMRGALRHLDKAIKTMEGVGVLLGSDDELARAYYLKANIVLAGPHKQADLERLLTKAVQAAPNHQPDIAFVSDPRIVPLYTRVLERHNAQGQQAVLAAQALVEDKHYCEAARLLQPFQNAYGDQALLGEQLYFVSQRLCVPQDATSAAGRKQALAHTAQSAALPLRQQALQDAPAAGGGHRQRYGVLPVIIRNLPGRDALSRDFSLGTLTHSMSSALGANAQLVEFDGAALDSWKRTNGISNFVDIIVRPGLVRFGWGILDVIKGKSGGMDVALGALPERYAMAVKDLMAQERLDYLLVVMVESLPAPGSSGVGSDALSVDILINCFRARNVHEPAVAHMWRGLPEIDAQERFTKIGGVVAQGLQKVN